MKKNLLIGIVFNLFFGFSAYAQVQKSNVYWGGSIGFNGSSSKYSFAHSTESGHNSRNLLSPEVQFGYFLNNSTMIGIGLKYNLEFFKTLYDPNQQQNKGVNQVAQLLPFVRKYKVLNDRWSIFIHGEIGTGYRWNKSETMGGDNRTYRGHYWQHNLSIKPGLVYHFPRNNWAVEGYANLLALNAEYLPMVSDGVKQFNLESGLTTDFATYFTIRVAKYLSRSTK